MPVRRRSLSEHDRSAWAQYATQVRALPGVDVPPAPEPLAPPSAPVTPAAVAVRLRARPAPIDVGAHPAGVDGATWTRFRTGKLPAVRTLDLHGRTAQRAHMALHTFLRQAHAEGVRCVEVITGRGLNSREGGEGGVIRRELPLWLNGPDLRPLVLAAAHPHPANPGSVRVLLRRIR